MFHLLNYEKDFDQFSYTSLGSSVSSIPGRTTKVIFLFATASRLALRPNKPPNQWITKAYLQGVKWPMLEADPSPPLCEVKNMWSYISPIRFRGMVLN